MEARGRARFADRPVPVGRIGDRGYQRLVAARDDWARRARRRHRRRQVGVLVAFGLVVLGLSLRGRLDLTADALLARAIAKEGDAVAAAIRRVEVTVTRFGKPDVHMRADLQDGKVTMPVWKELAGIAQIDVDVQEPLSATRFGGWRSRLSAERRDQVMMRGDLLTLQTTASAGNTRVRELLIQRATYRVVGQTWTLMDGGRVAVTETLVEPASTETPAVAGKRVIEEVDSVAEERELSAHLVVSQVDPIERVNVTRTSERVVVSGEIASAATRRALSTRLASLAGIEVRLAPGKATTHGRPGRGLATWTARTLGDEQAQRRFVSAWQVAATGVQRHAGRLVLLASRYPAASERAMPRGARAMLRTVVAYEYRALIRDVLALDAHSTLFGVGARGVLPSLSEEPPPNWRTRVPRALQAADGVRAGVDELLVTGHASERVSEHLTQLWGALRPMRATPDDGREPHKPDR